MPFLGLDDSQQFSNLDKFWIFVVAAIALTALTFFGSAVWDSTRVKHGSQSSLHGGEAEIFDTDGKVLEPIPYIEPSTQELVEQVTTLLGKDDNKVDDDADDATPEDRNTSNTSQTKDYIIRSAAACRLSQPWG